MQKIINEKTKDLCSVSAAYWRAVLPQVQKSAPQGWADQVSWASASIQANWACLTRLNGSSWLPAGGPDDTVAGHRAANSEKWNMNAQLTFLLYFWNNGSYVAYSNGVNWRGDQVHRSRCGWSRYTAEAHLVRMRGSNKIDLLVFDGPRLNDTFF